MPEWVDVLLTFAGLAGGGWALRVSYRSEGKRIRTSEKVDRLYMKLANRIAEHIESNLHR